MTRLAEDGCLLAPESADEIRLSTTHPASPNIPLSTAHPARPNNILLSTTTNGCLRANGPPGSAERGHGLVPVLAGSLEERHGGRATTISSDQNVCMLPAMSSMKERHSDRATTISSAQNECLLAPMSSMNETRLATTPSAESRPAEE